MRICSGDDFAGQPEGEVKKMKNNLKRKINNLKPFDELTITDDFMFGAVMSDPGNLKPLLECILGVKISYIDYPERQKTIDVNYGYKGVRLDVYCEDNEKTVYSVEIQTTDQKNLAKRIRYYHDMINVNILDKGSNYRYLKKSYVIFICTFDNFDKGRYMYTFRSQCQEDRSVFLGDETTSIILNINGSIGEINEELKNVLGYMAGHDPSGGYAERLENAVKEVKINEKWRREYMTLAMRLDEEREVADLNRVISAVKKLRGQLDKKTLADVFNLDSGRLNEILNAIDENPGKSDWEIANIILFN